MIILTWWDVVLAIGFCAALAAILTAFVRAWQRNRNPLE